PAPKPASPAPESEKPHHRISAKEANLRNAAKEAGVTEQAIKDDKKAKRKRGLAGRIMIGLSIFILIAATAAGFGGFMFYQSLLTNMPPLDLGKREEYSMASRIYDKNGAFVAEYGTNENVEWADSKEIPRC
ncbi:MAG: hypothetical protein IKD68_08365, partial [Solobacterium sp.]|nr:hypothetical protein [Solobacterium sp.]